MTFLTIAIIAVAWLALSVIVVAICAAAGRAEQAQTSEPAPQRATARGPLGQVYPRFFTHSGRSAVKRPTAGFTALAIKRPARTPSHRDRGARAAR
jgi:hypothetical protein